MSKRPITTFSSLAVSASATNTANGLYAPQLTTSIRDNIPASILKNGGIIYNTTANAMQMRVGDAWVGVGSGNVTGPALSVDSNIATWDGVTGKLIQDSGVAITQVPAAIAALSIPEFMLAKASLINVNQIGELGHIQFINDVGTVFVDDLTAVQYINNDLGDDTQVCSLITGGLPSSSTTPSCLLELQTTTGGFVHARLTTVQRDALFATKGMEIYNTTLDKLNTYNGTSWEINGDVTGPASSAVDNIATYDNLTGTLLKDSGVSITDVYSEGNPTRLIDTSGSTFSVFVGLLAGTTGGSGSGNVGVGATTLGNLTTGANNIGYGWQSLLSTNTGNDNTGIGTGAAVNVTSGNQNVAIGTRALNNTNSGSDNIAIGHHAAYNASTVSGTIAIGTEALTTNTGINNSAIGYFALRNNFTGAGNVAFGNNVLAANLLGNDNVGMGYNALALNISGSGNIGLGTNALSKVTSTGNIGIGRNSLLSLASGSMNVCVGGEGSLFGVTTGSNNICIGAASGSNNNFDNCSLLGSGTQINNNGVTNSTVIGFGTTTGVSNVVILGNGCNVGIGASSPTYALHLGIENGRTPQLYMDNTAAGTPPVTGGAYSVTGGKATFVSQDTVSTGILPTINESGAAPTAGRGVLLNGTTGVVVATSAITSTSIILVTRNSGAGAPTLTNYGQLATGSIINNTSFTIYSSDAADTAGVNWVIINA